MRTPAETMRVAKGRWEFLDAARAVAALLVLLQHSAEANPQFASFTSRWINFGEAGVIAFFLVSGYIIPASLERYNSVPKFWIGRAFRLLPAYWVSLLGVLLLEYFQQNFAPELIAHPIRFLVGNIAMLQGFFRTPYALGAYWTLSYELVFYCLCTLLFRFGLHKRSELWANVAVSVFLVANVFTFMLFHHALSSEKLAVVVTAFLGTLIFRVTNGECRPRALVFPMITMLPSIVVANYLRLGPYQSAPSRPISGDLSMICGFAIFSFFYAFRSRQFPSIVLSIGRISYSLYLWQGVILLFLWIARPDYTSMRVVVVLLASIFVAALSYRLVEMPALKLQSRIFPHQELIAVQGEHLIDSMERKVPEQDQCNR